MNRAIGRLGLAVLPVCFASCVYATLTPKGAQVRMTADPDAVDGCAFLGDVEGSDPWKGRSAQENATRKLKNATAALGGNVVLVTGSSATRGSTIRGEAYDCISPL